MKQEAWSKKKKALRFSLPASFIRYAATFFFIYSKISSTVRIFSASSSGISVSKASSSAITSSTTSRESAPRSSTMFAPGVTISLSTPSWFAIISMILVCSAVMLIEPSLSSQFSHSFLSASFYKSIEQNFQHARELIYKRIGTIPGEPFLYYSVRKAHSAVKDRLKIDVLENPLLSPFVDFPLKIRNGPHHFSEVLVRGVFAQVQLFLDDKPVETLVSVEEFEIHPDALGNHRQHVVAAVY